MPDIVLPNTFTDGTKLEAADASGNIYNPQSTPTTLEVMNGRLDIDNLNANPAIAKEMVRRKAFATGITRGHTANLDFYHDHFQGDYASADNDQAIAESQVVVGTTFYVPYACEAVYLTWHISMLVDAGFRYVDGVGVGDVDSANDGVPNDFVTAAPTWGDTLLVMAVDGYPREELSRRIADGRNSVLGTVVYTGGGVEKSMPSTAPAYTQEFWNDPLQPDLRVWSGHTIIDSVNDSDFTPVGVKLITSKGRHTADIRVTLGNWTHGTSGTLITAKHAKFLTCRVTAIPIR